MAKRVDPRVLQRRRAQEEEPELLPLPEPALEIPVFPEPNRLLRVAEGMVTWGDLLVLIYSIGGIIILGVGIKLTQDGASGVGGGLIGGGIGWVIVALVQRAWHHWAATVLEGFSRSLDQQQQQNLILAQIEERLSR